MIFLVDADLPRSTAQTLAGAGHSARHVNEVGPGSASDREIFEHAQQSSAVLVTRDLDFTDPLRFPERTHHGLIIVRVREILPPADVNQMLIGTVSGLRDDEFKNAIIIVEPNRFRRRVLQ